MVVTLPAARCIPPVVDRLKEVLAAHPGVIEVHLALQAVRAPPSCGSTTGCASPRRPRCTATSRRCSAPPASGDCAGARAGVSDVSRCATGPVGRAARGVA